MKITDKTIRELAHLARLEFDADGREKIQSDLERILDFCEKLNELDTDGVEPLIYLSDVEGGLREDIVEHTLSKLEALKNAPKSDSDYFRVPKVLNKKRTTSILGAQKVSKADIRIDAYGCIDELNSSIGWISTFDLAEEFNAQLREIQNTLFNIGSELASTPEALNKIKIQRVSADDVSFLENWIDDQTTRLPELKAFILPGSCPENAACHLGRTVCRRAERAVVKMSLNETVSGQLLIYLNRLSDYLFTLSRTMSVLANQSEIEWHPKP
jgi:cob(I)alamin adenosyltransferase